MLFTCFHHFLSRGLKLIALRLTTFRLICFPLAQDESVWMATAQTDDGNLARLKERAKPGCEREKNHLRVVNWAVRDVERPSNKRSRVSDHVPAPKSRLLEFSRVEFPRKTGWRGMMHPWGQRHGQLLQGANQARMRKSWGKKIKGAGRRGSFELKQRKTC